MSDKFLRWCTTSSGRRAVSYAAVGIVGSVSFAHFAPHTFFIDYYVEFLHHYRNGFAVPLTDETKKKLEKVLDLLEVNPEKRHIYQPFNIVGFQVAAIGSTLTNWGVRVGIPANFAYKKVSDIDTSRISLNGEKLASWETEAGKKLLTSLILSENAQNFAIAREIKLRESPKLLIDTLTATICSLGSYSVASSINTYNNLFAKPLGIRLIMYTLVSCFALGNYFFIKDFSQIHYEQEIDQELKEKSPEFAAGGKEYFTKMLLRNMCLRDLLGKEGEHMFSPLGNENYFLRTKSLPLMDRREFFE